MRTHTQRDHQRNKLTRILTIVWGELLHLRRTRIGIAFLLVLPTVTIVLMSYSVGDVSNIPVCVSNQDYGVPADTFISTLRGASAQNKSNTKPLFNIVIEGNITDEDARRLVLDRVVRMSVVIPAGFSKNVENNTKSSVKVYLDATDQAVYLAMDVGISAVMAKTSEKIAGQKYGGKTEIVIFDLNEQKVFGENLRSVDQLAPIFMSFFMSYICMSSCSLIIVRERVEGTIERLLLTPTRASEVIAGKLLYGVMVAVLETSILLILGVGIFKIRVVGNIFLVFSLLILIGLGGVGLGLVSSAVSKNELEALLWQAAYIVPALLLSGLMYPIEAMAPTIQILSSFVPMTHAIRALKLVMISGLGASSIVVQVFALSIFAAVTLMVGVALFGREMVGGV